MMTVETIIIEFTQFPLLASYIFTERKTLWESTYASESTIYYKMCVIPQSNPPIALGGDTRQNKIVSTVTAYGPITNSWDEVASLSGLRVYCAVAPTSRTGDWWLY